MLSNIFNLHTPLKSINMKTTDNASLNIAVWMDHSEAKVIDSTGTILTNVESPFKTHVRIDGEGADGHRLGNYRSTNNERTKNERSQNELRKFYQLVAEKLTPYKEIYVFGPTTAKNEFQNFLNTENLLPGRNIHTHSVDYMTEGEIAAHVRNHFKKETI